MHLLGFAPFRSFLFIFINIYCYHILIMDVSSGEDVPTRLILIEFVNFKSEQHELC